MFAPHMMGAERRLLPPSVPAAFFGFALVAQVLFWAVLLVFAPQAVGYPGGIGPVLGAVHVLTLGVLVMTAVGASLQILPVATMQSAVARWHGWSLFAPLAAAAVALPAGMAHYSIPGVIVGAVLALLGLGAYTVTLLRLLKNAHPDTVPDARGALWGGSAILVVFVALAVLLAIDGRAPVLGDHMATALAHLVLAGYGFMGFFAVGFSHVLMPMLALSEPLPPTSSRATVVVMAAGLALALAGIFLGLGPLVITAAGLGMVAAGLHIHLMARVLKVRIRRVLPRAFVLIRASWAMLPLSLLAGGLAAAGFAPERLGPAFVALLLPGWLLTLVVGVLQQILPFLGSMHTSKVSAIPATVTALGWDLPLRVNAVAHLAAVGLLTLGLITMEPVLVRLGAAAGVIAAGAFLTFGVTVLVRTRRYIRTTPSKAAAGAMS